MRSKLLNRSIIRKVVGAVLSSNLSSREIIDFSHELANNSELAFELAQALKFSMQLLDEEPSVHLEPIAFDPPWLAVIVDQIQKKKIPKREIIRLLPQRYISHISSPTLQKMSLKDLLLRAFENSNQAIINSFIRKLGVDSEPDPYLTGIEKKD